MRGQAAMLAGSRDTVSRPLMGGKVALNQKNVTEMIVKACKYLGK